jgi:hypothetical protein
MSTISSRDNHALTSFENLALSLIFQVMGESRYNRSFDEYLEIASRAPSLKILHFRVSEALSKLAPSEICRFKAGDKRIIYEQTPLSLSMEVIRSAWAKSGMRDLQKMARQTKL